MSKIISAEARISAKDNTGNVFDQIAKKFKGIEKNAKALEGIKAPKFTGDLYEELKRLKLSEKELQGVRKEFDKFHSALKSEPLRAAHYFRAVDDWKGKTVGHWREVKASVDEAEKSHARFFKSAGRFAMVAGGIGAGAYAVNRAGRAAIGANATWAREGARDYLAGMPQSESDRIAAEARRVSGKYQSVDASTMHERLRDTAMSMRSTDKALELGETIAQGTTVLQSLKGKDAAIEEGRKFFSALDVLGKNVDPKEVKELFDGYIKALGVEGADMDLGGALQMARQARAAGGVLSNRFLMTTAPGLARDLGDAQLGTSLSSALSQNVGGRATKQSKTAQQEYGLRDKQGRFIDADLAMRDPDKYAWDKIMPALVKKGVDIDDNVKVTEALAKLFSNRTVQDVFGKLITQREQYQAKAEQYGRAPGLAGAAGLQTRDPFVAWEGLMAQMRNFATLAPVMNTATAGLGELSFMIGRLNEAVATGKLPEESPMGRFLKRQRETGFWASSDNFREGQYRDLMSTQLRELDQKLSPGYGLDEKTAGALRLKRLDKQIGLDQSNNLRDMPGIFSDDDLERWQEIERERSRGNAYSRLGRGDTSSIPLPASRPSNLGAGAFPPVQPMEGAEQRVSVDGKVEGEAKLEVKVDASEYLKALVSKMEQGIKLIGSLSSNGPGSSGKSSPDANAPSAGFNTGMPLP